MTRQPRKNKDDVIVKGAFPLLETDRKIVKKTKWPLLLSAFLLVSVIVVGVIYYFPRNMASSLSVDQSKITIATVKQQNFSDFIPLRGQIQPRETVILDIVQEGRVEEIFQKAGAHVQKGAPLFRISNPALELSILAQETGAIDQLNTQASLQMNALQTVNATEADQLEAQYKVIQLSRRYSQTRPLADSGTLKQTDAQTLQEDLDYWQKMVVLKGESLIKVRQQAAEIDLSVQETSKRLKTTINMAQNQLESLTIQAPITGYLTGLDVKIGQHVNIGLSVGQIDNQNGYKVEALIDEFYLARIQLNQPITTIIDGIECRLRVSSISPQINKGQFKIEALFENEPPSSVRRGQSIVGKIQMTGGSPTALVLPMGAFWNDTGGTWVFVISGDGVATRKSIQTGRRTIEAVEILGGLTEGDRVITSSYQDYLNFTRLNFE